ncbi:MAG: ABC transporter permease [Planctomycetales bacterium]|nr:ABC transporter permease [Planctomycetales bacterium]
MVSRFVHSGYLTLLLCGVYCLAVGTWVPGFFTLENAHNVLLALLPLLVVATGQTVVLMTAGIDLSVTSIIAITSVIGAQLITSDGGPLAENWLATPIAAIAMLCLGVGLGLANGICVAVLKMPAFIATLTSMMFLSGLAIWWTQSEQIYNLPRSFLSIGNQLGSVLLITILLTGSVHFLINRTLFGMRLRAVGHNPLAARTSGVPVSKTIVWAYVLSGFTAALASVLITGQLETGSPVQWENNLLDIVGATVIGGTSLYGGRGSVIWTASGVLLLSLIDSSLNLLSLSHFTIMMIKGAVILLAALLDTLRYRVNEGNH